MVDNVVLQIHRLCDVVLGFVSRVSLIQYGLVLLRNCHFVLELRYFNMMKVARVFLIRARNLDWTKVLVMVLLSTFILSAKVRHLTLSYLVQLKAF